MTAHAEIQEDKPIRIGLAGLDNTRVIAFAKLLQDQNVEGSRDRKGVRITAAWPGKPSPDFAMSYARYDRFRNELQERYDVEMLNSLDEVAERVDAWMLEAVDGRSREDLFGRLVAYGKPIFVDKPFSLDARAANRMMSMAAAAGVPVMSCSALRYAASLTDALSDSSLGRIHGADFHGPMELEPTQPGYFWYGIHTAEMLFRTFGPRCIAVTAYRTKSGDFASAEWEDGRIGTIRGFRTGNEGFGASIHRERGSMMINDLSEGKPYLTTLMDEIVAFFRSGISPIGPESTLAIIRFLEAANESVESGGKRILL
ncbi:Gfo/Idh/MocA family protein [Paenibacillus sp. strain BS8-2]